ncbi:MAG: hypothetical protein WD737_00365 [Gemmatimonadota bacterium]
MNLALLDRAFLLLTGYRDEHADRYRSLAGLPRTKSDDTEAGAGEREAREDAATDPSDPAAHASEG